MRIGLLRFLLLCLAVATPLACSPDAGRRPGGTGDNDGGSDAQTMRVDPTDTDGDNIADQDEDRRGDVDTDGDGTPDYMDLDSDDDSIPDSEEVFDTDVQTPPNDSDSDGIPNFRDPDSDNNGVLDIREGAGDIDGDGTPDFADLDNDGDFLPDIEEIGAAPDTPFDSNGDGTPDYLDPDSDDDMILDGHEGPRMTDTDLDGTVDLADTDSDNDGFLDIDEAGDADLMTAPVDTDGDGVPDFRDLDSDGDGLSDSDERDFGSSRIDADTDMDGVTDLIEFAAGTNPADAMDSPRTRGDFVFLVPFEMMPEPTRDTLQFRTSIQFADIYFMFDTSTSMAAEISAMQTSVENTLRDLTCDDFGVACMVDSECVGTGPGGIDGVCSLNGRCTEDPTASSCVASPWSGAGEYERTFIHVTDLQPDPAVTRTGMNSIRATDPGTENLYQAVECVGDPASGTSCNGCSAKGMGFVGCPNYREEAVKILVIFTDEDSDGGTLAEATAAMNLHGIRTIGVWSGTNTTWRMALETLSTNTSSVDAMGRPLVFDGMNASVSGTVTNAINTVVEGVPLRVTIGATDEPDDAGDALQFIDYLEVNVTEAGCTDVMPREDTDGDTRDDAFSALTPGTPVCWDVVPLMNTTVMETPSPQVFQATITVFGDGSPLDARRVYFLVPPRIEGPMGPM
ncbi:MAG: hypothetical protein AAGF12_09195 [Myxococcota bacterium]